MIDATLRSRVLAWIAEDPDAQIALMGDWNIAPQDDDVWDIDLFVDGGYTHVPPRDGWKLDEWSRMLPYAVI